MSKNFSEYAPITPVLHQMLLKARSQGSGLDAKTIAEVVGKPYQTLMSELSRQEGHKLSVDLLLPLHHATGLDWALKLICSEAGGSFVPVPEASVGSIGLLRGLSNSIKEFGEFATETSRDISDGKVPPDQLAHIKKEGQEAIAAIAGMIKLAEAAYQQQYAER